jgi:hypothetical protein
VSLLLSPKVWVALAFAAVLAALGVQTMRLNHAHTRYAQLEARIAEERQRAAEAARIAEQEAREEEQRREQRKQEIIDAVEERTELAKASAADAERAAAGLRERLAAFTAAVRRATKDSQPAKRGEGKQDSDSLDMLAGVLQRSDDGAGEMASYADRLRIAGIACEQAYDGLRR